MPLPASVQSAPAPTPATAAAAQPGAVPPPPAEVELSIIAPALDEEENVEALVAEIRRVIIDVGIAAELIVVDDGSSDATLARLQALRRDHPWLRPLHRPRPMGQSAAMSAGIRAARGRYVAMLDADLQNDPADIPRMLEMLRAGEVDFAQGCRTRRQDTLVRKVTSWVGRTTRRLILGDTIRDTGCTLRVIRADLAHHFPLHFRGMHRFLPVYARMMGARVVEVTCNHRPRVAGTAKYGILNRGLVGFFDCLAVRWMLRRYRDPGVIDPPAEDAT